MFTIFAEYLRDGIFSFSKDDNHHFGTVNRLKIGEEIRVIFAGHAYLSQITKTNPLEARIVKEVEDRERKRKIAIAMPLLKNHKEEDVLLMATQLGVNAVYFYTSSYSLLNKEAYTKKKERFEKLIKEAASQCGRSVLPFLPDKSFTFEELFSLPYPNIVMADEHLASEKNDYDFDDKDILFISGPEGGFNEKEVAFARDNAKLISLGPRILRAETAPIYFLSVMSYLDEVSFKK